MDGRYLHFVRTTLSLEGFIQKLCELPLENASLILFRGVLITLWNAARARNLVTT